MAIQQINSVALIEPFFRYGKSLIESRKSEIAFLAGRPNFNSILGDFDGRTKNSINGIYFGDLFGVGRNVQLRRPT